MVLTREIAQCRTLLRSYIRQAYAAWIIRKMW
jgi:hypothetical protein